MLVDEVTRQVTSAAIAYEDAGEQALKGKGEPVHLLAADPGGRAGSGASSAERAWRRRWWVATRTCG